jgi:hypothetical protein
LVLAINTETRSVGELHNGVDHVVVGLAESLDRLVTGAAGVIHNHVDVAGGKTFLGEGSLTADGGSLGGLGLGSSLSLGSGELTFSELLGLSLLHAGVGVLELEFTEDGEGFTVTFGTENLGLIDDEDKTVTLAEGNAGNTVELLHADLEESLAALLFTSVELGTI